MLIFPTSSFVRLLRASHAFVQPDASDLRISCSCTLPLLPTAAPEAVCNLTQKLLGVLVMYGESLVTGMMASHFHTPRSIPSTLSPSEPWPRSAPLPYLNVPNTLLTTFIAAGAVFRIVIIANFFCVRTRMQRLSWSLTTISTPTNLTLRRSHQESTDVPPRATT